MSIFISIISPEKGYLVADSRATGNDGKIDEDSTKIFRLSNHLIIGAGGDAPIGDYLIKKFQLRIRKLSALSIDKFVEQAKVIMFKELLSCDLKTLKQRNATFIVIGINEEGHPTRRVFHTDPTLSDEATAANGDYPLVNIEPPRGLPEDECYAEFFAKLHQLCPDITQAAPEQFRDAALLAIPELALRNPYINNKCQEEMVEWRLSSLQNV